MNDANESEANGPDAVASDAGESQAAVAPAQPAEPDVRRAQRWPRAWAWALGAVILLTVLVKFAEPVKDADLWWQMAYGRYLLQNRTAVPDHTIYTWMPSHNETVYCAWLAEIFLYLTYRVGGLPLLFLFRYAGMLVLVFIVWSCARNRGVVDHPLAWFVCLLSLLMSSNASFIKPQLFSLIFMALIVWVWSQIKRTGLDTWRWCYLFPAIMLVWVNTHGGFIFGMTFLACIAVGEAMNALYSPETQLPLQVRRHLYAALVLSGLMLLVTPYGWAYIEHLSGFLFGGKSSITELKTVRDYDSIFEPTQRGFHFVEFLFIGAAVVAGLFAVSVKRRRIDWALLGSNVVFGFLYTRFLRTTFYWAPIFSVSSVMLLADRPARLFPQARPARWIFAGTITCLCMLLGGRSAYEHVVRPNLSSWCGFGTSYINPVEEAEYIAENLADLRLGNDYNSGGYLLWRLWPKTKTFIDPRYFPFTKWYSEYRAVETTVGIREFLRKYPCDVWCVIFPLKRSVEWFRRAPEWVPVFYGSSSAVFVRQDLSPAGTRVQAGKSIGDIRNLYQALLVLSFALNVNDWDGAERLVTAMETSRRFGTPRQSRFVRRARTLLQAFKAYHQRDYRSALLYLKSAPPDLDPPSPALLLKCYHHLAVSHWRKKEHRQAVEYALAALKEKPDDIVALYNTGVAEWYLQQTGAALSGQMPGAWADALRRVLGSSATTAVPQRARETANAILAGTFRGEPPLIAPREPTAPR